MLTGAEKRVLEHLDVDELIRWTRELVRIPSVYRPKTGEAEEPAARWVEERCREIGLETHWEVVEPGRPNVIAVYGRLGEGPCLMFEGHIDVVTEGDRLAWTHDPFAAEMEGGRIYGRGANDMKGGLVAALAAIKAIVRSGVSLDGAILLGALADEEGLMKGVKHFVSAGWAEKVSAAIICEPEDNRLCIAQKGVMWLRVIVKGKMAHGCMPLTGINPIYQMGVLLAELKALEAEEIARHGRDPYLGQPSITPTIIQAPVRGEPQNNVLPAQCLLTLDIRLIPGQKAEEIEERIRDICRRLHEKDSTFDADLELIEARPPTATPREERVVTELARAYRDATGKEPVYGGVPGSTDGTILFGWAGVPIVTCGPGDSEIPHHVDEYLDVDQLIDASRTYALAALRYLRR